MKYVLTIFITAVIVLAAATIYFKGFPTFPKYPATPVATESSAVSTATPETTTKATIKAGGILVFKAYTVDVPSDWQYSKEGAPSGDIQLDKLTLTKGAYKITIYQAATGGAPCLYPGDPDVEGPSSRFTSFVELTTQTGDKLRRGEVSGSTGFTVCEKQGTNGYGQPTSFGHISIQVPAGGATPAMILEIDSILSSLKKI